MENFEDFVLELVYTVAQMGTRRVEYKKLKSFFKL